MHALTRRFGEVLFGTLVALPVALVMLHGCCALKSHHHRRVSPEVRAEPADEMELASQVGLDRVLRLGPTEGKPPAIVLLHEIGGATLETLELGERLRHEGYTVYIPVLFGKVGERSEAFLPRCTSGDFHCARSLGGKLAQRLRTKLVEALAQRHSKIGAIGMCLTGSFPLVLAQSPDIQAVVVSQPAMPALSSGTRGISRAELEAIPKPLPYDILYFRFSKDCLSPQKRLDAFKQAFHDRLRSRVFPSCTAEHHAVLTDSLTETPEAWTCLKEYLEETLQGRKPVAPACPSQEELNRRAGSAPCERAKPCS